MIDPRDIDPRETALVLAYYVVRYADRVGKMPSKRDLDPVLVNSLIHTARDASTATRFLDAWFDSSDSWFERQGFGLEASCGAAMNRLFAQGDIEPAGGMTKLDRLARQLLVEMLLKPELRVVPPDPSLD